MGGLYEGLRKGRPQKRSIRFACSLPAPDLTPFLIHGREHCRVFAIAKTRDDDANDENSVPGVEWKLNPGR